jgi:hypothetical protein
MLDSEYLNLSQEMTRYSREFSQAAGQQVEILKGSPGDK